MQKHPPANMRNTIVAFAALLSLVGAHGSHSQEQLANPADDWALYHMQEEHRVLTPTISCRSLPF